jgi:hypothetical protein
MIILQAVIPQISTTSSRMSKRDLMLSTNRPTKDLTFGGELRENAIPCPSVCLAIPAFIASLGSVTDPLNYKWDCAYANELPVAVEDRTW